MTRDEALSFLREHQPMPDESELSEQLARTYEEVRRYFLEHPDPECIPLFLNSFGGGTGFGTYQLVDEVLYKFEKAQIVSHLAAALTAEHTSVRYWAAQLSLLFSDRSLVRPLMLLLEDGDPDCREAAAGALHDIDGPGVVEALRGALERERDPQVAESLRDMLEGLESPGL